MRAALVLALLAAAAAPAAACDGSDVCGDLIMECEQLCGADNMNRNSCDVYDDGSVISECACGAMRSSFGRKFGPDSPEALDTADALESAFFSDNFFSMPPVFASPRGLGFALQAPSMFFAADEEVPVRVTPLDLILGNLGFAFAREQPLVEPAAPNTEELDTFSTSEELALDLAFDRLVAANEAAHADQASGNKGAPALANNELFVVELGVGYGQPAAPAAADEKQSFADEHLPCFFRLLALAAAIYAALVVFEYVYTYFAGSDDEEQATEVDVAEATLTTPLLVTYEVAEQPLQPLRSERATYIPETAV